MKHIFIIREQPNSRELLQNIWNTCKMLQYDFEIVLVGSELQDVREVARNYKDKEVIIYACGSDLELHMILNEIFGGKAKLGIIPVDKLRDTYRNVVDCVFDVVPSNVMAVNGIKGLNLFSIGMGAEAIKKAQELNKSYGYSLLSGLATYKDKLLLIDKEVDWYSVVAVFNGTYYRGKSFSEMDIQNPEVRVYLGRYMNRLEELILSLQVFEGMQEIGSQIKSYDTNQKVRIKGIDEMVGQLDGEIIEGKEFEIEPHIGNIDIINNRPLIRELKKRVKLYDHRS